MLIEIIVKRCESSDSNKAFISNLIMAFFIDEHASQTFMNKTNEWVEIELACANRI